MDKYNIQTYKGDTYAGVQFEIKVNDVILDLSDYEIKMQIKKKPTDIDALLTLEIGGGLELVTDGTDGMFKINPFDVTLDAGVYLYDIQFTSIDNIIKTYISGLFEVIQDITS